MEGFWAFALPGGLWWEGALGGFGGYSCTDCVGHFGDSFCNVIACFYGNCNNLKVVFGSSKFLTFGLWFLIHDGLTVSDNHFRRVRDVDLKRDFAFIEFNDPRDADDARYSLNGRDFHGSRIIVEFAKGGPRGPGGSREHLGRGPPPPGSDRCFNCGLDGHWARDCKAGDWKNKCYRCGERGHIERNCQNSPKSLKRGRSYSRSLSRSPPPRRGRSRSPSFSRSRSYSRSRSPRPQRRERSVERKERRPRSPDYNKSTKPKSSPPLSKARKRSPTPDEESPRENDSPQRDSGERETVQRNGSDYSESPRDKSKSPMSPERDNSPIDERYQSPEMNGRSRSPRGKNRSSISPERENSPIDERYPSPETNGRSPSPRDDRSPNDDDYNNGSPRGSDSEGQ